MSKSLRRVAAALIACTAGAAFAQPAITSLGGGGPVSVTNSIGGTIYIGGSGLFSTAADRWSSHRQHTVGERDRRRRRRRALG